ncbi:hypothetical protein K493DRAFT_340889 [Basidiobolus meristosporus CBS 931.73]|uniref:HAM1-like N-terminal domain-containing protein n=1 Tax=Basidiobolus meristosporus CBS 931.73 TaxID=1314790 RepID=A0A1Y1XU83_9FUNG|nr:hypothetical protein K493DRAFT_340889 [Basidiobolus meristosporus CBS 931.73]|eukprot:ORX89056.1 hypothetical protein K493DRAFT_340889 [Basidiobolus meristosporus CBS 931.73]
MDHNKHTLPTSTNVPSARPATKEQEVLQKKEHVVNMVQAAQEGKMPSTAQITGAIQSVQEDNTLHNVSSNMSSSGRRVMADAEKLLDSTKQLLTEKNADDNLQNVIYHSMQGGKAAQSGNEISQTKQQLSGSADETKNLLSEGADKVTRVGWLLVTSSQFRRLMNDITSIFQELVAGNVSQHPEQSQNLSKTGGTQHTDSSGIPHDKEISADEAGQRVQETLQQSGRPLYESAKKVVKPYVEQAEDGKMPAADAAKGSMQDMQEGIQNRLKNVRLSSQQEDHLINRVKAVIRELQKNPEFQQAIDELSEIASSLKSHGSNVQSQIADTAQSKREAGGDDISIARSNAKQLVENFAGNKSLDPLIRAIEKLTDEFANDHELQAFIDDIKAFFHRSIRENEFVDRPEYKKEASSFIDRGQNIMDRKYRSHFQNISNEATEFNQSLQHDRTTQAFARDLETLTKDMFLDESGKPTIKYDLVKDFAKLIPVIAKKLEYLPLPRIENSDEQFDMILDNIVLKCTNIAPDFVHVKTDTVIDTNPNSQQNLHNNVFIKFANIQVEAKDIAFYYKKKTFPKISDVGYVDLLMPDDGITMDMTLNTTPTPDPVTGRNHVYQVRDISTVAKDLKLNIHDSKRDFLYKILSPIINSKVRKAIEEQVPIKMQEVMMKMDEQLMDNIENAKLKANSGSNVGDAHANLVKDPNPEWGSRAYNLEEPRIQHIQEQRKY